MKSYKFNLMQDCHELIVDESHSKIEISNAFCESAFDENFMTHSHIIVKFINETIVKEISYFTEIINWDNGILDKSMKKIQFDYSHNIPVGCNKIKICIVNRKAVDYRISIAIGLI